VTVLEIETTRRCEALDVTERVGDLGAGADGVLWLSTPHTTAALVVNEADGALLRDLERTAARLLEPLEPFEHARNDNPNAAAHLAAALFGRECLLGISGGRLELGAHQRVLLLELDGPKRRSVHATLLAPVDRGTP
jgi:secondary thiamine-phosphate synthase enzyme